jgi:hypothetical protein
MAPRKLRDRLNLLSNAAPAEEPTVSVPPADKAGALVEAAESGFAAIQALYADRNKSVELAQSLHRHNVYLLNLNNGLREELMHARQERDHYLRFNSRISAWVVQAHDLLGRISSEVLQTTSIVEHMPHVPMTNNNPVMEQLDATGCPFPQPVPAVDGLEMNEEPVSDENIASLAARFAVRQ